MINKILSFFLFFIVITNTILAQKVLKDSFYVKTDIYEAIYSEILEQPRQLTYYSINRPYNFSRAGMDFYLVDSVHTSGSSDYKSNVWDKGHLAPAASFSDTKKNLLLTFSYVNCSLQHKDLNRTEWKLLEEQERIWDDKEPLKITVILEFSPPNFTKTNACIPSAFHKHIYWTQSGKKECYYFPNKKPTKIWTKYLKKDCNLL